MPEAVREFTAKYPNIKNVILTGGMVKCPGFVERLKDEVKDLDLVFKVDANFMWKQAAQIVSNK